MNQRVDLVRNSLPSSNKLVLETTEETEDGIVFRALTKRVPCCPACLQSRVSYHSHYVRRMRDLPWQGRRVEIHLKTRRFLSRCTQIADFELESHFTAVKSRLTKTSLRINRGQNSGVTSSAV